MEKCSESIGIKLHLNFFDKLLINDQPHTIDSLFAYKTFLLIFTKLRVGSRPEIPGIAEMV